MRKTITADVFNYFKKLGISKQATWEDTFVAFAEATGIEAGVEVGIVDGIVEFYKGDEKFATYKVPRLSLMNDSGTDLDFNTQYFTILQCVMENGLYKKSKRTKGAISQEVTGKKVDVSTPKQVKPAVEKERVNLNNLSDLRAQRDRISVKLYDWRKKGKDISSLEVELAAIKDKIKSLVESHKNK